MKVKKNEFARGNQGKIMWVCYIKLGSDTGQHIRPNTIDRRRAVQEERLNNRNKRRQQDDECYPITGYLGVFTENKLTYSLPLKEILFF